MAGVKSRKGDGGKQRVRMLNGKVVKPVAYGPKMKIVAEIDGEMLRDENGVPIPFKSVGELIAK